MYFPIWGELSVRSKFAHGELQQHCLIFGVLCVQDLHGSWIPVMCNPYCLKLQHPSKLLCSSWVCILYQLFLIVMSVFIFCTALSLIFLIFSPSVLHSKWFLQFFNTHRVCLRSRCHSYIKLVFFLVSDVNSALNKHPYICSVHNTALNNGTFCIIPVLYLLISSPLTFYETHGYAHVHYCTLIWK